MSLLLALLVAFGRLSADREFVALQACGVSLYRLFRPGHVRRNDQLPCHGLRLHGADSGRESDLPGNHLQHHGVQRGKRGQTQGLLRRVPEHRHLRPGVAADRRLGWGLHRRQPLRRRVIGLSGPARPGRRQSRREDAWRWSWRTGPTTRSMPRADTGLPVARASCSTSVPKACSRRGGIPKGLREMSVPELTRAHRRRCAPRATSPHNEIFELHKRFSIPAACLVFGLIGLALGATNRRDAKLASFVLGIGVIFAYYLLLWFGQSLVKGQRHPIVARGVAGQPGPRSLGADAVQMARSRRRSADSRSRFLKRSADASQSARRPFGHVALPFGILDRYVAFTYLRLLGLAALALGGVFYVSTFIESVRERLQGNRHLDDAGDVLRLHDAAVSLLHRSALGPARLARHGRHSDQEQRARRDEGVRHQPVPHSRCRWWRGPWPPVHFSLPSNRPSSVRPIVARRRSATSSTGGSPETFDVLNRRWVVGRDGAIYHYTYFDPRARLFTGLWVYEFDEGMRRITQRTFADQARYSEQHVERRTWLDQSIRPEWRVGFLRRVRQRQRAPSNPRNTSRPSRPIRSS